MGGNFKIIPYIIFTELVWAFMQNYIQKVMNFVFSLKESKEKLNYHFFFVLKLIRT